MSSQHYKYLVLGGGNASGYVAKAFVEKGLAPGELCILTDEQVVAYERPALSKAYLFPEGFARLPGFHTTVGGGGERQDAAWYSAKGIEYRTGARVVAADAAAKKLTLASGDTVTGDALIIATGARPIKLSEFGTPGADLAGVQQLRNVADADALVAGVKAAKAAGGKVVVVGGGYIGMEVAAAVSLWGVDVTVVFPEPHLMSRLFTPQLAAFYEGRYTARGIVLKSESVAAGFEGKDGQVTGVRLKDGTLLEADLAVVGVGARPNGDLFDGQLETDRGGIVVDGSLRTSAPGVYAIGDVASFPLLRAGGARARQEHVTHCRQSAAHVVAALHGSTEPYDYLPFFYSRVFDLSWQFYGSSEGSVVHWGDQAAGKFGAYWVKDGRVVGAFMESGSPDEFAGLKALAAAQPPLPLGGEEELAQQGVAFALAAKL